MVVPGRRIEIDNVVRIGSRKEIDTYTHSIVLRAQPRVYNKYGCIKIRFTGDLCRDIDYLCRLFWHLGLVVKNVEKMEGGLEVGRGRYLENAFEITLVKIGAIEFEDDSEYKTWIPELKKFEGSE